jgi:pantoate--beta-alanine ligase
LTLDYADFIDEETFEPAQRDSKNVRAIVAGWINGVRLIDNMRMEARV